MTWLNLEHLEARLTPATTAADLVQPAGQFNWLQATPGGGLMELVFKGDQLTSRDRVNSGWVEQDVVPGGESDLPFGGIAFNFRETIEEQARGAQLLVTPDGVAHAFLPGFGGTFAESFFTLEHYTRAAGGRWQFAESVRASDALASNSFFVDNVTGAVGADGSLHLVVAVRDSAAEQGQLRYVTNKTGSWQSEAIPVVFFPVTDVSTGAYFATRYLSVAVDSTNAVHVAFTPRFELESFGRVFSQLAYASNRGGSWVGEIVYSPPDGTGDAGLASSVAVGPGDQVAIASYYVDRVGTGSPASAQLLYHQRAGTGWQTSTVADRSDNYAAADGPQYTGVSPLLQFDGGTPVITFSDVAVQHINGSAREYGGQIRTATRAGGSWQLATVFRQANPLGNILLYPVRTVVGGTPVYAGLLANYAQDGSGAVVEESGTYQLLELNAPNVAPVGPEAGTPGGQLGAGVVGAGAGGGAVVRVYGSTGERTLNTTVFGSSFTGGVRVAAADFNADGTPDVVAGTGPGAATRVRVLDGSTGTELFALDPFEASFTGGVYVAAGDLTGDGVPDVVITPDEGGGPRVRVINGATRGVAADFFGIDDVNFRGGARAAVGDLSGDDNADLIVVAGFGGGPRVAGFDGTTLASGTPVKLFNDFFAFEQDLRNGVFVAVADLDGDGFAELVAGGGPGGGPRVTAFDGKNLLQDRSVTPVNFFAGDTANRGGVRLAARDVDGDGNVDLLAGAGTAAGSRVTAYRGSALLAGDTTPLRDFDAFLGFDGGVFVG